MWVARPILSDPGGHRYWDLSPRSTLLFSGPPPVLMLILDLRSRVGSAAPVGKSLKTQNISSKHFLLHFTLGAWTSEPQTRGTWN